MLAVNPINSLSRNECKQTNKQTKKLQLVMNVAEIKMSQEMVSEKESITGIIHIKSFLSTLNTQTSVCIFSILISTHFLGC